MRNCTREPSRTLDNSELEASSPEYNGNQPLSNRSQPLDVFRLACALLLSDSVQGDSSTLKRTFLDAAILVALRLPAAFVSAQPAPAAATPKPNPHLRIALAAAEHRGAQGGRRRRHCRQSGYGLLPAGSHRTQSRLFRAPKCSLDSTHHRHDAAGGQRRSGPGRSHLLARRVV